MNINNQKRGKYFQLDADNIHVDCFAHCCGYSPRNYYLRFIIYTNSIRQHALIDELQLDHQLNNCVSKGDRAKFALLLSMLAPDVTDQTQYYINEIATGDTPAEKEQDLRAQFELPPKPKAFIDDDDVARMSHLNQLAAIKDVAALRLEMCLAPEPSILKSEIKIPREVLQNTSHLCQLKLRQPQDLTAGETDHSDGIKSTESPQSDTNTGLSGSQLPHKPSMLDVLNAYDPSKPLTITALV